MYFMTSLGTIINTVAIIVGGIIGHFTGKLFKQEQQAALNKACGISVLFIAIAGAMQGMLHIDDDAVVSGKSMLVVLCLAIGTIIGELIGIEKGCVFSAIPVLVFEGIITLFARLVSPVMTDMAIAYLSLVGSILIFCVGVNLVWGKTIRVANMLPAVILAVIAAYIPWAF